MFEGLEAGHAYRPDELDDQTTRQLASAVESEPDHDLELVESRMLLYPALAQLTEREAKIIA